jgi:hypothetical protein
MKKLKNLKRLDLEFFPIFELYTKKLEEKEFKEKA